MINNLPPLLLHPQFSSVVKALGLGGGDVSRPGLSFARFSGNVTKPQLLGYRAAVLTAETRSLEEQGRCKLGRTPLNIEEGGGRGTRSLLPLGTSWNWQAVTGWEWLLHEFPVLC